jgi:hypothetical protein
MERRHSTSIYDFPPLTPRVPTIDRPASLKSTYRPVTATWIEPIVRAISGSHHRRRDQARSPAMASALLTSQ